MACSLRYKWYTHESCLLYYKTLSSKDKCCAFDLDSTLIQTASGKLFSIDGEDWMWNYSNTIKLLQVYNSLGYQIAIFTNQLKLSKDVAAVVEFKRKIKAIVRELALDSVVLIAATENDNYRKPSPEMWPLLESLTGSTYTKKLSLFIGDAAGRPDDFSCSDREFACNVGCKFYTPEEFFARDFTKQPIMHTGVKLARLPVVDVPEIAESKDQEIVLMCGSPASGKSTLALTAFPNYVYVNQDLLKTKAKCLRQVKQALECDKSVVVDNTNRDKKTRQDYIKLAEQYNVPIRCIYCVVDKPLAFVLNRFRVRLSRGERTSLPDIAFHSFYKNHEPPTNDEFSEVLVVPFSFKPATAEALALGKQYV